MKSIPDWWRDLDRPTMIGAIIGLAASAAIGVWWFYF